MKKKEMNNQPITSDVPASPEAVKISRKNTRKEESPCIDYAEEYKKQTGKEIETGEYVVQ